MPRVRPEAKVLGAPAGVLPLDLVKRALGGTRMPAAGRYLGCLAFTPMPTERFEADAWAIFEGDPVYEIDAESTLTPYPGAYALVALPHWRTGTVVVTVALLVDAGCGRVAAKWLRADVVALPGSFRVVGLIVGFTASREGDDGRVQRVSWYCDCGVAQNALDENRAWLPIGQREEAYLMQCRFAEREVERIPGVQRWHREAA